MDANSKWKKLLYRFGIGKWKKLLWRGKVGGMWEEIGMLQFQFLVAQGIRAEHRLLDVGCGCLRGGIHLTGYLSRWSLLRHRQKRVSA